MKLENIIKKTKKLLIIGGLSAFIGGCSILELAVEITDTTADIAMETTEEVVPWVPSPSEETYNSSNKSPPCGDQLFSKSFYFSWGVDDPFRLFKYLDTTFAIQVYFSDYSTPSSQGALINFCYTPSSYAFRPFKTLNESLYCDNIYLEDSIPKIIANDGTLKYRATFYNNSSNVIIEVRPDCPND